MADPLDQLRQCTGFQWDEGNLEKNWVAHQVRWVECEEIFFNEPLWISADVKHSEAESRFYALGQTEVGRLLFVVFTLRGSLIRIISARDMNRRERKEYQHAQNKKADPKDSEV